ncbi:MAG: ATP-binding protein [Chloroflexota bacterium]
MNATSNPNLLKRYQKLIELSLDLASTLDLKALLNRIVKVAADVCGSEEASILLYDPVKNVLYFEAATNLDEQKMEGFRVPVESSLAGWIVTNRQALNLANAQQDDRLFRQTAHITNVDTCSLLGVPLIDKDTVVGVLEAINKRDGEFDEDDQLILSALGAQAAVAIQNARLFQQSDLIAELVHELRTPMASLNTAVYLMARPEVKEDYRQKLIEMIREETSRISDLASTFLDLARLESGRANFRPEHFNPRLLLEDCDSVMHSRASEQGLDLTLRLPEKLPTLNADRDKLKQVILNLLSNAIKYNRPNGKITLSAETKGSEMIITVADTGHGISPEGLQGLFQRFYRVPGSEKIASGTGLGLSICKRIVEIHNGRIEVQSEVGVGTTFSVYLPCPSA